MNTTKMTIAELPEAVEAFISSGCDADQMRTLMDLLQAQTDYYQMRFWKMVDTQVTRTALSLVTLAKAHNSQSDTCWHGYPTYSYGCGIRGFDSQYGEALECHGCELGDSEPPSDTKDIYPWALATAQGRKWHTARNHFPEDFDFG